VIRENQRFLLARLEVSIDCEAELAVLLMGAARSGILKLDRILPFLKTETGEKPTAEERQSDDQHKGP